MATALADIHFKVDRGIKVESEEVLKKIGISFSDLFNMTLRRVVYERRIPFDTRVDQVMPPVSMQVDTKADMEARLLKSIKSDTGERHSIEQVKDAIVRKREALAT